MRKKPQIHTPFNNIKSNNQKIYYSGATKQPAEKFESDELTSLKSVGGNVLLAKKIDYLIKNPSIAKNVRVKTKDNSLTRTAILGKDGENLHTKHGNIKLSEIINIYLS